MDMTSGHLDGKDGQRVVADAPAHRQGPCTPVGTSHRTELPDALISRIAKQTMHCLLLADNPQRKN